MPKRPRIRAPVATRAVPIQVKNPTRSLLPRARTKGTKVARTMEKPERTNFKPSAVRRFRPSLWRSESTSSRLDACRCEFLQVDFEPRVHFATPKQQHVGAISDLLGSNAGLGMKSCRGLRSPWRPVPSLPGHRVRHPGRLVQVRSRLHRSQHFNRPAPLL